MRDGVYTDEVRQILDDPIGAHHMRFMLARALNTVMIYMLVARVSDVYGYQGIRSGDPTIHEGRPLVRQITSPHSNLNEVRPNTLMLHGDLIFWDIGTRQTQWRLGDCGRSCVRWY